MNNFKRNLLIGFGASLIILIASSSASYISIRNLLESASLVRHTNEVIIKLNDLNTALIDAETGQRGYLLTGNDDFLGPWQRAQGSIGSRLKEVKMLTLDNPEQQASLERLSSLVEKRLDYIRKGIDNKKNNDAVNEGLLVEGRMIMEEIRAIARTMEARETQLLTERTSSMNEFAANTPILIIAAAGLAMLITISFYARVQADFTERGKLQRELEQKDEDITRRIGIIRSIANNISAGNYTVRVHDEESDALGSVAGSLNKMAESLEYSFTLLSETEWKQSGIVNLNNLMIGEKDVTTLTREAIEFMASYAGCPVGAIYLAEGKELRFSAGYAYIPPAGRTTFMPGEGLIGQVAISQKTVELKDVPVESIYVSYATGEVRPAHILGVPVFDGRTLKGVIEFGSMQAFTKRDIEFFNSAAYSIGIAISMAQNRRKLEELLEETQSQAEELKAQHNELENMNSELEVQAEKLQASEEELKVQQEELKQANEELAERSRLLEERNQLISERNVEIQTKADQLTQSTRYKSEFLANMSHELRTPLNSILLLSRLMSENKESNLTEEQVEYARVIQSSGKGLLTLIDEILDLSKIEAGKMQLEYQVISIPEILHDMTALFNPMAQEKNIVFHTNLAAHVPETMETDKLRLEQIIKNLLSNAVKFTSQGSVTLEVAREEKNSSRLRFTVKDTGIGIPRDKQVLIFEAFQQADGSTRRKFGGTGLGLSISRELTRLLGGEITVKSEADQGSEFTIYIPVSKESVPKPEPIELEVPKPLAAEDELMKPLPPIGKYISTEIPPGIPDDRAMVQPGDKVMLIVEDDVNFAKSLLDYTRKRGYKGVVSVRGDEAITLAHQFHPYGILLDIQLPVKSGWEVMEELKSNPKTRHIPVHIMSSYEVKSESLLKGAVDFINKPVAFEKLQDVFQKIEYVLTNHPKKVLIVEENAKHAKALAYFLSTFDINLETRSEVNDAIGLLQSNQVDCVILDMGVPDQKAYDTLEGVKKTPGLENLPIIIFTGKSLSQAEELKIRQYADSIVVKTAHSYKRIIDEVSLFLHLMEKHDEPVRNTTRYHKLGALTDVLRDKTVLVVDDDIRNIFSLTKALENYQMKVLTAVDGKDALKQLDNNPDVDIVLMDMMMPEMDGYESTSIIRKNPRFKELPIIAVTAKAMMGDRIKCINAGASDYITKPVDIDQLLSLLRVWMYEKRIRY
jgi:signal transduction histidine kinase/DNA-binding response OmpR family regulator/CHASE3 domain sensor protein